MKRSTSTLKAAIQVMTWSGYAKEHNQPFVLDDVLREVKQAGYQGVELGGGEKVLGRPAELRKKLGDNGLELSAISTGVTYNPYPPNVEEYQADMRYAKEVGAKIMMVCGGFSYFGRRTQYPADYDLFASSLGPALKFAHELELEIAYHPHRGCIVETIAETKMMVQRLPDLKLCPDFAHLAACGEDALKFIRAFRNRIIYVHAKDYDVKKNVFTELGEGDGKLDVKVCLEALRKASYSGWIAVELDKTFRTPLESARISRTYLQRCGV